LKKEIKMTKRNEQIKKYGIEIVEQDEKIWKDRGYTIDYDKDLLVKIKEDKINKDYKIKLVREMKDALNEYRKFNSQADLSNINSFDVETVEGYLAYMLSLALDYITERKE